MSCSGDEGQEMEQAGRPWRRDDEHRYTELTRDGVQLTEEEEQERRDLALRHEAFLQEGVEALRQGKCVLESNLDSMELAEAASHTSTDFNDDHGLSKGRRVRNCGAVLAAVCVVLFACAIVPWVLLRSSHSREVEVVTPLGTVRGVAAGDGRRARRYLGIPYAEPPVGEGRWAPPRPKKAWSHAVEATKFKVGCHDLTGKGSEDCLYLNVFAPSAPQKGAEPLPVMYWVHGGCYTWGYGMGWGVEYAEYDGDVLAARENVIVVTAEYRIGALGFLFSEALLRRPGGPPTSGNYGFLDQVMVLRWIKENIASFGGDPKRVTLFGQSSGGGSVSLHLTSSLSEGLFTRAVIQSGSFPNWITQPRSVGQRNFEHVAREMQCHGDEQEVLDCLMAADAAVLSHRGRVPHAVGCRDGCLWAPVVDGYVIDDIPWRLLAAKQVNLVPTIVLSTLDDGSQFIADTVPLVPSHDRGNDTGTHPTHEQFLTWLNKTYEYPGHQPILELSAYYLPSDSPEHYDNETHRHGSFPSDADLYPRSVNDTRHSARFYAASAVETDIAYTCPAKRTTRELYRASLARGVEASVRHYKGVFRGGREHGMVSHSAEISSIFGTLSAAKRADPAARALSDIMMKYWANFARTGDPNGAGLPVWHPTTDVNDSTALFDTSPQPGVTTHNRYHVTRCAYWDAHWDHWGTCLPQPGRQVVPCKTVKGDACIFPFSSGESILTHCARDRSGAWCPTEVDAAGRTLVCMLPLTADPTLAQLHTENRFV